MIFQIILQESHVNLFMFMLEKAHNISPTGLVGIVPYQSLTDIFMTCNMILSRSVSILLL